MFSVCWEWIHSQNTKSKEAQIEALASAALKESLALTLAAYLIEVIKC